VSVASGSRSPAASSGPSPSSTSPERDLWVNIADALMHRASSGFLTVGRAVEKATHRLSPTDHLSEDH